MPSGGSRPGAGRKPKLPALRLQRGTKFGAGPKADAIDGQVLAPGEGLPDNVPIGTMVAPADLGDDELRYFGGIVRMLEEQKRASPHYELVVTLLARRLADVERLSAVISIDGDICESRSIKGAGDKAVITVMKRAHPAVVMRADAMRHAQSLLGELMLSPMTALKLGGGGKSDVNPFNF